MYNRGQAKIGDIAKMEWKYEQNRGHIDTKCKIGDVSKLGAI